MDIRWYLLECGHYGATSPHGRPEGVPNGIGTMLGCLPCSGPGFEANEGRVPIIKRRVVRQEFTASN